MYLTKIQEFKGMIGERSESGVKGRMREWGRRKKEGRKKKFLSEYIEKPRFRKCRIYAFFLSFNPPRYWKPEQKSVSHNDYNVTPVECMFGNVCLKKYF